MFEAFVNCSLLKCYPPPEIIAPFLLKDICPHGNTPHKTSYICVLVWWEAWGEKVGVCVNLCLSTPDKSWGIYKASFNPCAAAFCLPTHRQCVQCWRCFSVVGAVYLLLHQSLYLRAMSASWGSCSVSLGGICVKKCLHLIDHAFAPEIRSFAFGWSLQQCTGVVKWPHLVQRESPMLSVLDDSRV